MSRIVVSLALAAGIAAAFLGPPGASAQGNPPGTVTVSGAITGIEQLGGDLDRGGTVDWSSLSATAGVTRQFVPAFAAGVSLRYADEDWRFDTPAAFGAVPPWRHLQPPSIGINSSLALSRTLLVGVTPTIEWAYDSGAKTSEAVVYGAVASVVKVFTPRFVLGGGASVTRQFYNVKTSPFVIVNWRLTDRLRIANAIPSGPEGGAGVELRYAPTPDWELAAGGVSRSDRYRLAHRSGAKGDVGELSCIPLLARVSRTLDTRSRLDLYAGVMADGRLTVRDRDGRLLVRERTRPAATIAATLSRKF